MVTPGQVASGLSVLCPGTPGRGQGRQEKGQVVTGTWMPWLWRRDVVAVAGHSLPGCTEDLHFVTGSGRAPACLGLGCPS